MDISAETFHGCLKDLCMVECQFGELVNREPGGFFSIIASEDLMRPDQSIPGNGNRTLARVAVYIREDTQLAYRGIFQFGLFE